MIRALLLFLVLAPSLCFGGKARAAEPTEAEEKAVTEAQRRESIEEWAGAGFQWTRAMLQAERSGDYDRAIAHGEKSRSAWSRTDDSRGQDEQAFTLGVMSKLDLQQGRLTRARERNVEAARIITTRILQTSDWQAVPGQPAPARVPEALLEAWARANLDTARWLDNQGRTLDAVELLTAVEASLAAARPGARVAGFYHRKLISERASMLRFLGCEEQGLADLQRLVGGATGETKQAEFAQRFNLAYYRSTFEGPKSEFLEAARAVFREELATGVNSRETRRLLAKMAFAYGEAGADVRDLQEVIDEARAAGAEMEAIYAQRDLAILRFDDGKREGVEEGLRDSLLQVRERGIKLSEPYLYQQYGIFLASDGRAAEGLQMLREAVRLTRAFGWTQHLPRRLSCLAEVQSALGDVAGMEQTLAELDALIAGGELLAPREFIAGCARARILLLLGRNALALDAIAKAVTTADRVGLNEYQRAALNWTREVKPIELPSAPTITATSAVQFVDLQPVGIRANYGAEGAASARFHLSNLGTQAAEGTLEVDAKGVSANHIAATGVVAVVINPMGEVERASLALRIGAGEAIAIKLFAQALRANITARLKWRDAATSALAVCEFQPDQTGDDTKAGATIRNRSLAWQNPFYAVPLSHPVRVKREVQNFRVLPSGPCRVEIINAQTGKVIAIDADGDGAFQSVGDSVLSDRDGARFPELPGDPVTGDGEITILVFPYTGATRVAVDMKIELQVRTAAGWQNLACDLLKSSGEH